MATVRPKTIREMDQVASSSTEPANTVNSNATISDLLISSQTSVSQANKTLVKQISKLYSCDQCNNFYSVSKVEFNRHVKSHKPQEEKFVLIFFIKKTKKI
jgi:hypothetical protein